MSINQASQTLEELMIMEQFKRKFKDFPKGKVVKSESPDFIVELSSKISIGIELTKLHGPSINKVKSHFTSKISGYQAPEFSRENIEFTIEAKNKKLIFYRKKYIKVLWLLITADIDESSVSFNLYNKLDNWIFNSGFQRIFLFELKEEKIFELRLSV
jgi:hypothetical protein